MQIQSKDIKIFIYINSYARDIQTAYWDWCVNPWYTHWEHSSKKYKRRVERWEKMVSSSNHIFFDWCCFEFDIPE